MPSSTNALSFSLSPRAAILFASCTLLAGLGTSHGQAVSALQAAPQAGAPLSFKAAFFEPAPLFPEAYSSSAAAEEALPEAPQAQLGDPKLAHGTTPSQKIAQKRTKTIPAGWHAQLLNAHWKVRVGAEDLYSVDNLAAIFISAGYSHLVNGQPNYGTDKGAFGERLGAAAIRETTQGVFTDMVFAPLLHEDPRYYVEGPDYSPVHRTLYAITRPLITRSDSGKQTINGALLLGYAASAAVTPAFYPQINRNFHDTASTFGGSIGGAALGFFVSEFSNDLLYAVHLRRQP